MNLALFDFDGTIADSGSTILAAARAALERLGHPVPDATLLHAFIGPPLLRGITEVLGVPHSQAEEFRRVYRSIYVEGMTKTPVFPGMRDLLAGLREEGWVLAVASSKREDLVQRILGAQGLAGQFTVVAGADRAEQNAGKEWVIGRALRLLEEAGVDGAGAIMIGDRVHDVEGAAAQGLRSVFVRWGYGTDAEADGAHAVVDSPAALADLLRGFAQRPAEKAPAPAV